MGEDVRHDEELRRFYEVSDEEDGGKQAKRKKKASAASVGQGNDGEDSLAQSKADWLSQFADDSSSDSEEQGEDEGDASDSSDAEADPLDGEDPEALAEAEAQAAAGLPEEEEVERGDVSSGGPSRCWRMCRRAAVLFFLVLPAGSLTFSLSACGV